MAALPDTLPPSLALVIAPQLGGAQLLGAVLTVRHGVVRMQADKGEDTALD